MSTQVTNHLQHITDIVCAYVSKNNLSTEQLMKFISELHELFHSLSHPSTSKDPAVNIKKSVQPDHLICLEDGKKLKVLTRYLRNRYNLSPDDYRTKWGLPADYPMIAPNYASTRSAIAKERGLGKRKQA